MNIIDKGIEKEMVEIDLSKRNRINTLNGLCSEDSLKTLQNIVIKNSKLHNTKTCYIKFKMVDFPDHVYEKYGDNFMLFSVTEDNIIGINLPLKYYYCLIDIMNTVVDFFIFGLKQNGYDIETIVDNNHILYKVTM